MAGLAFGIDSAEGFFEKLQAEQADVCRAPANARHSINAALTAYHMLEWIWARSIKPLSVPERKLVTGEIIRDSDQFISWALGECADIELMRAVSNGSKHLTPHKSVTSTSASTADWSGNGDWSREDFSVSRFLLAMDDGTEVPFEESLNRTVDWYRSILVRIRNVASHAQGSTATGPSLS